MVRAALASCGCVWVSCKRFVGVQMGLRCGRCVEEAGSGVCAHTRSRSKSTTIESSATARPGSRAELTAEGDELFSALPGHFPASVPPVPSETPPAARTALSGHVPTSVPRFPSRIEPTAHSTRPDHAPTSMPRVKVEEWDLAACCLTFAWRSSATWMT